MKNNFGKVERQRHNSLGNRCLLVVVNSIGSYWDYSIVDETVLTALEHFGMPYTVLDLAKQRLTPQILRSCAGIILAQSRLGNFLTDEEMKLIAETVEEGTGLVNFDNDIRHYNSEYLKIFGFDKINPHPYATDVVRIKNNKHYITEMQIDGEYHKFNKMVTAIAVEKWGLDVKPLAEGLLGKEQLIYIRHVAPWSAYEPGNYPVVFATRRGKGKAVQFTINPRIWRNEIYGHTGGLGDLFWRSIIWAVKKPFVTNMIPPFVTMSFDDCSGRHDFAYVDIAVKHGYVPMPSLFLRNVPERLFPKIKEGLLDKRVSYNSHALDYYNLLYYHYGKGEMSSEELERVFEFEDSWWRRVGATPGKTIRFHLGDCGVNSLPYLKKRGRLFFCPALQTGLPKADMCYSDGFWPYNLQTCYYDYLPDDNDFFAFAAMLSRFREDFLTGCTPYLAESLNTDVDKAGRSAANQILHGLRAGFYAEIVTHEQKFENMTMDEWDNILKLAGQLTGKYEKIYAGHDDIGRYLKGKDGVWINSLNIDEAGVQCTLKGKTDVPLSISVFRDEDEYVIREYKKVECFEEEAKINIDKIK
ncbi:MAG: hypothetical protein HPY74_00220 [Firmicutes bacterium]|nr:hypothetical protein [Bacillota bacterium]